MTRSPSTSSISSRLTVPCITASRSNPADIHSASIPKSASVSVTSTARSCAGLRLSPSRGICCNLGIASVNALNNISSFTSSLPLAANLGDIASHAATKSTTLDPPAPPNVTLPGSRLTSTDNPPGRPLSSRASLVDVPTALAARSSSPSRITALLARPRIGLPRVVVVVVVIFRANLPRAHHLEPSLSRVPSREIALERADATTVIALRVSPPSSARSRAFSRGADCGRATTSSRRHRGDRPECTWERARVARRRTWRRACRARIARGRRLDRTRRSGRRERAGIDAHDARDG